MTGTEELDKVARILDSTMTYVAASFVLLAYEAAKQTLSEANVPLTDSNILSELLYRSRAMVERVDLKIKD